MNPLPPISPFKLLQPYGKEDAGAFFGRETETRRLTETLMRSKFLLVYGASGTGKTSLIQCGLPGMLSPRDWLPLYIRRDANFVDSMRESVMEQYRRRYALRYPGREPDLPADLTLRDAVKYLFHIAYVPVYLILDQFEELFTLGDEYEQQAFFQALGELRLFEEDLFCKVLLVTREEYIAHFYRYEQTLPFLFEHRYRVEKMRQEQLVQSVAGLLAYPYPGYPRFEVPGGVPAQIVDNLTDERGEVDLTTLQVYLDRLYREDSKRAAAAKRDYLKMDKTLVGNNKLPGVLADFLDGQITRVEQQIAAPLHLGLQILFKFVTSQGTKQNRPAGEVQEELSAGRFDVSIEQVRQYLHAFAGPDCRILTRLRYAKTGEERYELAHDRLAEVVFGKFNAAENRRREAITTIQNRKKRFEETAGNEKLQRQEYLSLGELELIGQSLNIARLKPSEQAFFNDSKKYHIRKRRRERSITVVSIIAAIAFLAIAGLAFSYSQEVIEQRENAEAAKEDAQKAEKRALNAEQIALDSATVAQQQRQIAQQETNKALAALEQSRKDQINRLKSDAVFYRSEQRYNDAIRAYRAALIQANAKEKTDIELALQQTKQEQQEHDFDYNRRLGLAMKVANNCKSALIYLEKALEARPGNVEIQKAIEACK